MERLQQLLQINRSSGEQFSALRTTTNADIYQDRAVIAPYHTLDISLNTNVITIIIKSDSLLHIKLHSNKDFFPLYGFGVLNTLPSEPYNCLIIDNPNEDSVAIDFLIMDVK